jgi:hypothetical protein
MVVRIHLTARHMRIVKRFASDVCAVEARNSGNHVCLYFNDVYKVELPAGHRFPMDKYRATRCILQSEYHDHDNVSFIESPLVRVEDLITTHSTDYVNNYMNGLMTEQEIRRVGFPWSKSGISLPLNVIFMLKWKL